MDYGYKKQVNLSFNKAVDEVRTELAKEGFGILTEIDVKETLKKKLDVDFGNYLILGACNPPFALRALQAEKDIGLLLPCNVIVYEDKNNVFVSAIVPTVVMGIVDNPTIPEIASTIEKKLKKVINSVAGEKENSLNNVKGL